MKRPNWIELFIALALAVLTVAWLDLWVRWLVRLAAPGRFAPDLSALLMLAIVVSMTLVTRVILNLRWSLRRARVVVTAAGLAAIVGAQWIMYGARFPSDYVHGLMDWGFFISPELMVLLASAFLVWRGVVIGRSQMPHDDLVQTFYSGFLTLALLFLFDQLFLVLSPGEALLPTLVYFTTGLSALALSSFEHSRRLQKEATGIWLALNRYWLATTAGVIGGLLGIGLIVTALVAPESFAYFGALLRPVSDALATYLEPFLLILALILALMAAPIFWLVEWLRQFMSTGPPPTPTPEALATPGPPSTPEAAGNTAVILGNRGLFTLVALGVFIVLIWFALRRFLSQPNAEADETRESIVSFELMMGQLKKLFSRRRPAGAARPLPPYLPLTGPPDDPRLIVRRAYQALLAWAQTLRPPRAPGQTPSQYAAVLTLAVPEGEEAIAALTDAYVRVRYSAEAPSLEEAHNVEGAVAQLQAIVAEREARR